MQYGRVIETAFKSVFKAWGEWLFVLSVWAAGIPVLIVLCGGCVAAGLAYQDAAQHLTFVAVMELAAGLVVGAAGFLVLGLVMHGGLVHLTSEWQEGRTATVGDGWRAGRSMFGRVFVFELLYGLVSSLIWAVPVGVLLAATAAAVAGAAGSGIANLRSFEGALGALAAVSVPVCCLYVVVLALMTLAGAVMQAFESVGVREAVIAGVDGAEAFRSAWRGLKARKKEFLLMGLITVGLAQVFEMAVTVVSQPVQMLSKATPSGTYSDLPYAILLVLVMVGTIMLTTAMQIPWAVFIYQVWTAFYRQVTGRDTVPDAAQAAPAAGGPIPPPPTVPPAPEG